MKSIKDIAEEILGSQAQQQAEEQQRKERELAVRLDYLATEFREAFREVIPLLEKEGIEWKPEVVDKQYPSDHGLIIFKLGRKTLKMDFSDRTHYRYEHAVSRWSHSSQQYTSNAQMAYGKWDTDRFIVWIYQELIDQPEPAEYEENNHE